LFKITSYYNYALALPSLLFQPPTLNMVSQEGALYDDDSRNRGDDYFSKKSQGSKTAKASSLATAVSDSDNGEGMELAAGLFRARTQA
jgi:hypothetical protein